MQSQKIENLLNLALQATEAERERSAILDLGYEDMENTWELIIKYSGNLERIEKIAVEVTPLLTEYAIVIVRETDLDALSALEEIEYIEKPKRLYFQTENAIRVSCIQEVKKVEELSGAGTYLAVIDSGIDLTLPVFRKEDGKTRVKYFYDQTTETEYSENEINELLRRYDTSDFDLFLRTTDVSGHGTAVTGIAATIAPASDLIVVKMGNAREQGFPRTTQLMSGVDYVMRKALYENRPIAVNISFGNSYGAHDGRSLVEQYMNRVSELGRTSICVGAGNEGRGAGHTSIRLENNRTEIVELAVQERESSISVQVWKAYTDRIQFAVRAPSGEILGPITERSGVQRYRSGQTELLVYYGEPKPYQIKQEIFLDFIPDNAYLSSGVWEVILEAEEITDGEIEFWIPGSAVLNLGSGFLNPDPDLTLTIPSTAANVITVGAYDAFTFSYADFSGRGSEKELSYLSDIKPDLAAPGVGILSVVPSGGTASFTGTSFATPVVTGSAALLLEWGIVRKNDSYLYGEKLKAYLRRGAKKLPGYETWPNPYLGYGVLCLKDSLPL